MIRYFALGFIMGYFMSFALSFIDFRSKIKSIEIESLKDEANIIDEVYIKDIERIYE